MLGVGLRPRRNRRPKVSRDIGDLRLAGWLGQRPATALRVDHFLRVASVLEGSDQDLFDDIAEQVPGHGSLDVRPVYPH